MNYCPLMTIKLNHSYYINGLSTDFRLEPSGETARLMKGHRLKWLDKKSTWQIITEVNEEGTPFLPINGGTMLRFYLSAITPGIIHITDWDQVVGISLDFGKVLSRQYFIHFTYEGTSSLKGGVYQHISEETLHVTSPGEEEVFFLRGRLIDEVTATDFTIEGMQAPVQYDPVHKKLTLDTRGYTPGFKLNVRYPSVPEWAQGVIGVVDIPLFDPNALFQVYHLNLPARTALWTYYVASKRSFDTISIADVPDNMLDDNQIPIEFRSDEIRVLTEDDPTANWMTRKFPLSYELIRFTSKWAIPYTDTLQKNICLFGNGQVLLSHLPVPSLEKPEKLIVTYLS